jgi:hypothetical protein
MDFHDPLLLEVKMFLAEFSWIRHQQYEYPFKVCTHFTKDVFDKATAIGMRCACALVSFENTGIQHAIVAFQTDYGLIYIEPQTGEQENIVIGKPYPMMLAEVPSESFISSIRVSWNDTLTLKWLECRDCGYLLPTTAITDYCPACTSTNTKLEMSSVLKGVPPES